MLLLKEKVGAGCCEAGGLFSLIDSARANAVRLDLLTKAGPRPASRVQRERHLYKVLYHNALTLPILAYTTLDKVV